MSETVEVSKRSVALEAYGGEIIERVVIAETDTHVFVCRDEELAAAKRQGRKPQTVGFQRQFIREAL